MHRPPSALLALAGAVVLAACGDGPPVAPDSGPDGLLAAQAKLPTSCPTDSHRRGPEQVLEDHRAALAAGDLDAVYCNYAPDAVVIGDGGVDSGHEMIRASLAFFLEIFDGTQPQVVEEITTEVLKNRTYMVRLRFTIDTPCVSVPDGIDTYLIRHGRIHGQTSHASPVFHCLP